MNREKTLFLVVLAIVLLWGGLEITDVYEPPNGGRVPEGPELGETPPTPEKLANVKPPDRLSIILRRSPGLDNDLLGARPGRTILVPHSDLLPVERADLPLPRAMPTPVVLPPIHPFPPVPWFRTFRVDALPGVTGGPEAQPEPGTAPMNFGNDNEDEGDEGDFEEEDELDTGSVLESAKKWEFKPEEWDSLDLGFGQKWYGRISLTDERKKQGRTKYDLLLPENAELPFYFERIDTKNGRMLGASTTTLAASKIRSVEFADTIENRYWSRRVVDHIAPDDRDDLLELGRRVMDLAEQERYERLKGLQLAATTFKQALEAAPDDVEATLALGEAYHRAFRYNEELDLYVEALAKAEDVVPDLLVRKARVLAKFDLLEPAEEALSKALGRAPGDIRARLMRGDIRIRRAHRVELEERPGLLAAAIEDFREVTDSGTADEQAKAREGHARALILLGRPAEAQTLLEGATDAASLNTLGAAYYAQRKFVDALDAFLNAAEADPESFQATTNLGFAKAQTATDWQTLDDAASTLQKARAMYPLNYYWPPLGLGFIEQRRGDPVNHPDCFTRSVEHYQTALTALPIAPYVHYILGVSYRRDGRAEDARKQFLEALRLDFRFVDALIGYGTASLELEDWTAARNYLGRALQVEPDSMLLLYRLGRAYLMSADLPVGPRFREAKKLFQTMLDKDPRNAAAFNGLGYISYMQGDVEQAMDLFDRALAVAPQPKDDPERVYGDDAKKLIVDSLSRRIWVDKFERPSSRIVGNNWKQSERGTVVPQIRDGKAVVSGRQNSSELIYLTYSGKVKNARLNKVFISFEAKIRLRPQDQVNFQVVVLNRPGNRSAEVNAGVGIEKTARGEVNLIWRRQRDEDWIRKPLSFEWPADWVTVRIQRVDQAKGHFTVYFDGEPVGWTDDDGEEQTVIKDLIRQHPSTLEVGFMWKAPPGESHETEIEEVTIEQYVD